MTSVSKLSFSQRPCQYLNKTIKIGITTIENSSLLKTFSLQTNKKQGQVSV